MKVSCDETERSFYSLAMGDQDVNLGLLATLSSKLRRGQSMVEGNDTNIQKETEVRILVQMLLADSSLHFFSLFICNQVSLNNTSTCF